MDYHLLHDATPCTHRTYEFPNAMDLAIFFWSCTADTRSLTGYRKRNCVILMGGQ